MGPEGTRIRLALRIHGVVQGVGFRPFVHGLARQMGLTGWVGNDGQGVSLEIEGPEAIVEDFQSRLETQRPPQARLDRVQVERLPPAFTPGFEIRASQGGKKTAAIPPDLATCGDCLRELFDPNARRYRYPFLNCTHCGPRYSIVEAIPYDRPNTSMRAFVLCGDCQREYQNPADRRFHAQPIACPQCGPHLEFWDEKGKVVASREEALDSAVEAIRGGRIVAAKGVGGFHLLVDARQEAAVRRLRERKARPDKPLAIMAPDLGWAEKFLKLDPLGLGLLTSPQAPIVLVPRKHAEEIAPSVAPGHPDLGVMLPYSPLHHLMMAELRSPIVATSGNRSEEPICIEERDALLRLKGIADFFLVHNRPIVRPVEDSVVGKVAGRPMVLRLGRGYAPVSMEEDSEGPPLLARGGHLKNTVTLGSGRGIWVSQHIGDLETEVARVACASAVREFLSYHEVRPAYQVRDLHPDYATSLAAEREDFPSLAVQHHHAHIAACMGEHGLEGPVLGVAWDGAGLGPDGTLWGGEFLIADRAEFRRFAHFRTFPLPGGEVAVREPRRALLGLLYEFFGEGVFDQRDWTGIFSPVEIRALKGLLSRLSPRTSSAGRLFDAVAALLGVRQKNSYEGQAAQELMFLAERGGAEGSYPLGWVSLDFGFQLDWQGLVDGLLVDLRQGLCPASLAGKFHQTLAEGICLVARRAGLPRVVLGGGCFQNRLLTALAVDRLQREGFEVYWPQKIPPNDGGLSFGQFVVARARLKGEAPCV